MNMNNDDFFNDIHDDVASDFRDQVCLPQEPNNKNKMILAVIASATTAQENCLPGCARSVWKKLFTSAVSIPWNAPAIDETK